MYFRNTCFKVGMSYGRHIRYEVRFYRKACYAGEHVLLEGMLCCGLVFYRISVVGGHV